MLVWLMCLLRFAQTVNFWRNVGKTYTHVIFNDKSGSVLRLHICECGKRTMTTFRNPLADPLGTRRGPPLVRGPQFENRWNKEHLSVEVCALRALLVIIITFAKEVMRLFIYLFTCLFVSRITQKVIGWFYWNFQGRLDLAQLRGG